MSTPCPAGGALGRGYLTQNSRMSPEPGEREEPGPQCGTEEDREHGASVGTSQASLSCVTLEKEFLKR